MIKAREKILAFVAIGILGCLSVLGAADTLQSVGHLQMNSSPVIDDLDLRDKLHRFLAEVAERDSHVSGRDLASQLEGAQNSKFSITPYRADSLETMQYDKQVHGVVLVASVYKCGKCDKWHLGHQSTGWILSADGLMVTNNHVFEGNSSEAYGVLTLDGRFAEILKVEKANKAADIAVFRVKGEGFTPLPLANAVRVGDRVHVISHPDNRFFTYTSGSVSRMFAKRARGRELPATWMTITADFARGSSGGPVLNDQGQVVGMVSRTDTIYYYGNHPRKENAEHPDKGPSQMVVKNCVSLQEIRALLTNNSDHTENKHSQAQADNASPKIMQGVPMLTRSKTGKAVRPMTMTKGAPLVKMQGSTAQRAEGPGPESLIGKPLNDFMLLTIDDKKLTKKDTLGKVLLIDFWASWCGPCKAASPILQELHESLSEKGLWVIGANTSERNRQGEMTKTPKIAKAYARKNGYSYTFTYGSDELKDACLVRGLPTMFIVDRDGIVRDVVVGFNKELKAILTSKITPLL